MTSTAKDDTPATPSPTSCLYSSTPDSPRIASMVVPYKPFSSWVPFPVKKVKRPLLSFSYFFCHSLVRTAMGSSIIRFSFSALSACWYNSFCKIISSFDRVFKGLSEILFFVLICFIISFNIFCSCWSVSISLGSLLESVKFKNFVLSGTSIRISFLP